MHYVLGVDNEEAFLKKTAENFNVAFRLWGGKNGPNPFPGRIS